MNDTTAASKRLELANAACRKLRHYIDVLEEMRELGTPDLLWLQEAVQAGETAVERLSELRDAAWRDSHDQHDAPLTGEAAAINLRAWQCAHQVLHDWGVLLDRAGNDIFSMTQPWSLKMQTLAEEGASMSDKILPEAEPRSDQDKPQALQ
jgi:hypothetical protein